MFTNLDSLSLRKWMEAFFSSTVIVDGEASETDDEEFEDCVDDEETMETIEKEDISKHSSRSLYPQE